MRTVFEELRNFRFPRRLDPKQSKQHFVDAIKLALFIFVIKYAAAFGPFQALSERSYLVFMTLIYVVAFPTVAVLLLHFIFSWLESKSALPYLGAGLSAFAAACIAIGVVIYRIGV